MKLEEHQEICFKFKQYATNKILVYGTGVLAEKIIDALQSFNIVGVVDKSRSCGVFKGISILSWDEVNVGTAEVIIIAAAKKNYEKIFRRIQDKCIVCRFIVLGCAGENLNIYFGNEINRTDLLEYCKKNLEDLKAKIQNYDAVSFDVFDTLIMRKTLESEDVFEIVDKRIKAKGIYISDFKKKRIEAGRLTVEGTLEKIYDVLKEISGLSTEQTMSILKEEIQCERELIIPRYDMIYVMQYAYDLGKKISLISDTYISEKTLMMILHELNIKKFHKLYVTFDHKTGNKDRLFVTYQRDVNNERCLHVGNNKLFDKRKIQQYGFDLYEIKSAYEMLQISEMHSILGYTNNISEKNLVGLLISELFNSPFSLYGTFGILRVRNFKLFGKLFFSPLVILYITELIQYLLKNKNYDGVLFAARDGYLFYKLYEKIKTQWELNIPKSFYFLTSRKLSLRASMKEDELIQVLNSYLNTNSTEHILKNIIGLQQIKERKPRETEEDYIERHKDLITKKSLYTQNNYLLYMKNEGIDVNKKYLFCELDSQGTTQYALNYLFKIPLDGFYLSRYYTKNNFDLPIFSLYDAGKYITRMDMVVLFASFQEVILSSPFSSVQDMDMKGEAIYDKESRSLTDINIMKKVQDGIEDFFEEYINELYVPYQKIKPEIPELIFRLLNRVIFEEECLNLKDIKLYDNLLNDENNVYD